MASTAMDVGIAIPIILIRLFLVDAIVLPPRSFLLEPFSICPVFEFSPVGGDRIDRLPTLAGT
jgi:hypothetical protein